ncbi:MAG: DUF751 family protein [Synechococcaceae cyanobacterium RL_1_2]|jgi:uncharacterized membrane protein|nr:DUF751 family protein [Synechococcaceae cyanobacterium RL_1_2]
MGDFFQNVSRYPRYLISLILGIFFALYEKLKPMAKNNPIAATAIAGVLLGLFSFLYFTLKAMLGLSPL